MRFRRSLWALSRTGGNFIEGPRNEYDSDCHMKNVWRRCDTEFCPLVQSGVIPNSAENRSGPGICT
ncbi:hypothetical protein L810_8458 [Burkholderia sp. AU4i]|nr:hypothetical protein L810_8458 [Burkholderia sp. AU4i]